MCQCRAVLFLLIQVPPGPYILYHYLYHLLLPPNHVFSEEEDYTGREFQVPFPEGVIKATFSIPIVNDTVFEPDEYFSLELEIPQAAQDIGVMGGNPFMANVTITNDERECSLLTYVPQSPSITCPSACKCSLQHSFTPAVL